MNDVLVELAKNDPKKLIEATFWIENKSAEIVPFRFNEVQNDYYRGRTNREDILKARQQGFSSLILALFTIDFIFNPNIWCVCVSHESKATERLFRKVHMYLKRLPFEVQMDTSRADMLVNKNNGSVFYIGTAGSRAFGQGDTVHRLHLSEFSRYSDPERIVKNVYPSVPNSGVIVKETTANGMNNYHHREWVKEKQGESAFRPFFSPWFKTKEYSLQPPTKMALTTEEQKMMETYKLSVEQLYWRKQKISELGSVESFKEQYPANDLEAFISSGVSAYSKEALAYFYENTCREPNIVAVFDESATPRLQDEPNGYMKIWEKPLPNSSYFISADVGKSGDYCSASVWHWGRNEQVATIHGHFEPHEFGKILYKAGAFYQYATIIPENNGIGAGVVGALSILNYPYIYATKVLQEGREVKDFGINTNVRTRPLLISAGQKAIRDRAVLIRDREYIIEMQSFQRTVQGRFEGVSDERGIMHDDRVMEFNIGQYFYQSNPMPEFRGFNMQNPISQPDSSSPMTESGDNLFSDYSV